MSLLWNLSTALALAGLITLFQRTTMIPVNTDMMDDMGKYASPNVPSAPAAGLKLFFDSLASGCLVKEVEPTPWTTTPPLPERHTGPW